jgi:hypothetical protein
MSFPNCYRVAKGKQFKGRFGRKGKDEEDDTTGVSSMASSMTASPTSSSNGQPDSTTTNSTSPPSGVVNMAHIHRPFKKVGWHASKKTKNLKQIITLEKAKEWKTSTPTCKRDSFRFDRN